MFASTYTRLSIDWKTLFERFVTAAGDRADRIVIREIGETFVVPTADALPN
jgi:hypothetical protein